MSAIQERPRNIIASDFLPHIATYSEHHISPDGKFLHITLNQQTFPLPLVNVGNTEHPAYIAWLDTHPDHEGVPLGLAHATAVERANILCKMVTEKNQHITTIVTPDSSKSIPSIQETVAIASDKLKRKFNFIILPGGKDENEVAKRSAIAPIAYRNVTSPDHDKFLGITASDLQTIIDCNLQGAGIVEIDDVYTSGGTDDAAQNVLNTILHLPSTFRHPLIVVARESQYDSGYPHKAPDHVLAVMHLPEFTNGFKK